MLKRDIRKIRSIKDHIKNEYYETFAVPVNTISSKGFYFISYYKQNLLEKLKGTKLKLKDISATKKETSALFEGSSTGYKDIYVTRFIKKSGFYSIIKSPLDGKEYRVENELIKTYVEDAGKWSPMYKNFVLIFPYQKSGNKYQIITEKELKDKFPLCWEYFNEHKNLLKSRKSLKNPVWYAYSAPRSLENYGIVKLLIQGFSIYSSVSIDETGNIFFGPDIYGLPVIETHQKLTKYFLAVLNSNLTNFFIRQVGVIHGSGYYKYEDRFIKNLPIKLPETTEEKKIANEVIRKVDEILELHKSRITDIDAVLEGKETEKLHQLPKVSFNIGDNTRFEKVKSDGNKIYINSQDFIEIKDKKIKDFVEIYLNSTNDKFVKAKDVKNRILNISVPKSDEFLKEIIKKGGADQSQIKDKIKKFEYEINELVYQIYGITKEERKIVEANL